MLVSLQGVAVNNWLLLGSVLFPSMMEVSLQGAAITTGFFQELFCSHL